jgi:ferric-dicitrate binding protein FerR (iron transport regulator)
MGPSSLPLLERYLSGDCPEQERLLVEAWLDRMETPSPEWASMDAPARAAWMASLYKDIQRTIAMGSESDIIPGHTPVVAPAREAVRVLPLRRRALRFAAAAAVVLLAGTGAYLWIRHRPHTETQVAVTAVPARDALPGHDGAVLTLANRQQVVLDSLGDGLITRQGQASVLIQKGQLAYTVTGTDTSALYNTLTTPRGRQYHFVLPDGSRVWLNAASSITYPTAFTGKGRFVSITGEVYLEVAKDKSRPFRIGTRGPEVDVLGTNVDVNTYPDEPAIRTTLLEGGVRVAAVVLRPGEQAVTGAKTVVKKVDPDAVMAWKNGYFQFEDADIRTVMRQLSRWYDLEVVYEGTLPADRFGGKLPRDANASEILKSLEQTQVHFRIEGKKLIVMP